MPELPEVETTRRRLEQSLIGQTFDSVTVTWPRSIRTPVSELQRELPGLRIEALDRRGKYLSFRLSNGYFLLLHLKMSGRLMVESKAIKPHLHVRTRFGLSNGHELRFKDTRKFGRVYFLKDAKPILGKLGPEPLDDHFTPDAFQRLCRGHKGRLKPSLLNQEFIAGIGNIYADESCFEAGLHPASRLEDLSNSDLRRLYKAIRTILTKALNYEGTTLDEVYPEGEFQNHFQVYGRREQTCFRCQTPIQRIILAGRSTHFCPVCQPCAKEH
ncbi:bifunctional DNA-formamidopyrimidine glycosylase/DNA-(apurinic or apyrimidinic site) lyase [bacterium]|nr:bifunctional DNA-formamidopyrimidine glycosylase/DNA-(apurinic or apyrimidinic site) lyase [bacterium]